MRNKTEILAELRTMLRDIFTAKAAGETHARLARAHGYVDGYMRAVLETGVATRSELVEIVAAERERSSGPAMTLRDDVNEVWRGKTPAASEPPAAPASTPDASNRTAAA